MTLFGEEPAGPAVCRLLVGYDGTGFRGFAAQPDQRTVEGALGKALAKVLRQEVALTCAGRTDAGVHAWGQVVSFDAPPGLEPDRVQSALNGLLGPEIVVRTAELAAPGFNARRSAKWRYYRYTIVNRPVPDPFLVRYAWWVEQPLELAALRHGRRPVRRRARLLVVLPAGHRRGQPLPAGVRVPLDRAGRRDPPLRRAGQRVLLADGAVARRARWSTSASASAGPVT